MYTNKSLTIFSVSALICALGISASWAEVTHDEAVTKIHALAQKVEGSDAREKLFSAHETLTKAGVSTDKSLAFIEIAVEHKVPVEALIQEAREIQAEVEGNRAKADEYASEVMNQFSQQEFSQNRDQGHDLAHEIHDNRSLAEGLSGEMNGADSGFGSSDLGSGSGSGFGGVDIGGVDIGGVDIGGVDIGGVDIGGGAGAGDGAGAGMDIRTVSGNDR